MWVIQFEGTDGVTESSITWAVVNDSQPRPCFTHSTFSIQLPPLYILTVVNVRTFFLQIRLTDMYRQVDGP